MADCPHTDTRRLYQQLPPSQGRRLLKRGNFCLSCQALLPLAPNPTE